VFVTNVDCLEATQTNYFLEESCQELVHVLHRHVLTYVLTSSYDRGCVSPAGTWHRQLVTKWEVTWAAGKNWSSQIERVHISSRKQFTDEQINQTWLYICLNSFKLITVSPD